MLSLSTLLLVLLLISYGEHHSLDSEPKGAASLLQSNLLTSPTFVRPQVLDADPAPRGTDIKELHVDPRRAPFPSDDGSLRGVVVDEARPPGIAFHLGPD